MNEFSKALADIRRGQADFAAEFYRHRITVPYHRERRAVIDAIPALSAVDRPGVDVWQLIDTGGEQLASWFRNTYPDRDVPALYEVAEMYRNR